MLDLAYGGSGQDSSVAHPVASWLVQVGLLAESLVLAKRVDQRSQLREVRYHRLKGVSTWGQQSSEVRLIQYRSFGALVKL